MEQAIRQLETKIQDAYRILAAKKLKQLHYTLNNSNTVHKGQTYLAKNVHHKIKQNNAMIMQADKGKTLVIIYKQDFHNKVHTFLTDNKFQATPKNPTNKYQKQITQTVKQCNLIFNKEQIKHLTQRNPKPPTLKARLKLHKAGNLIRPVINNRNAPSYKAAKKLNRILQQDLSLDNRFTTVNSSTLAQDLTKLNINKKHRLITSDKKDLYVNIPITETIYIARTQLLKHDPEIITQICRLLETILQQNYFIFQEQIYQPDKGIVMGSPTSGTIAEIFLQHLEHIHIRPLIDSKQILFYTHYTDDILIIYDTESTNQDSLTQYTNSMHTDLQFNPTQESNGCIHFLDLTIIRRTSHIEIDIYRKPTATDTTIHFTSIHPNEHKLAAYRYYIQRMLNLPLNAEHRKREWSTILHIAQQNGFPPTIIQKLRHQMKHKTKHTTQHTNMNKNKRWVTFTYISPQIRKVTSIFRNTNVKIAFGCRNTIANLNKPSKDHNIPPHNKWGIYQLTCNLAYVGQTSCSLNICFKEHIRYIRNINPQSAYAQHIQQNQHEYGQMNSIMTLLKPLNNPSLLIPYEQYYIQTLYREGKLILEQNPGEINPLFQTVINSQPPYSTWTDQLCFSLQHGYHSNPTTPKLQNTSNQGMCNLKITIT